MRSWRRAASRFGRALPWGVTVAALVLSLLGSFVLAQPTFTVQTALVAYKLATGVVSEVTPSNPLPLNLAQAAGVTMTSQNAGALDTTLRFLAGSPIANNAGATTAGTMRVALASDTQQASLAQTGTAAAGTGVTLTLAAGGANTFQYVTAIEITQFAAAALTAAATPVLCTTTNLSNTPSISLSASAMAQGTVERVFYVFDWPLKAAAANTAVTIVCPNTTNVIFRLNAFYTVAA
jgi:hypothetical protein